MSRPECAWAIGRPRIRWIVFDVGETLIDESRQWHEWADILGVPRFTFAAALGGVIALGEDHRRVFDYVAPGIDWRAARAARPDLPTPSRIEPRDLYPDVVFGLDALRAAGFRIGIAGNQPAASEDAMRRFGIRADLHGSSETYSATKPEAAFFERLVAATGAPAGEVAYVGDRIENDVHPAIALGLHGVLLRRGPWAAIGAVVRPAGPEVPTIGRIVDLLDLFEPLDRPTGRTLPGTPDAPERADG